MQKFECVRAVVLFLAAGSATANAQVLQSLRSGDRARVVLRESQPQDEAPSRRELIVRGSVTRVAGDTVFLRPPGTVGDLGVPVVGAVKVYRSLGMRSRPASALRSGFFLAVMSSLYFGITYDGSDRDYGVVNRGEAFALGAGLGAATGLLLGALLPTERWQRVR